MKPEVLAQARRYYHHVLHGGTLRPEDVAFMVEALEEAAKQSKWVYLTEEEMLDIVDTYGMPLAEAIEAKLKGVYLTDEEMLDIVDTYGMPLADAIEAKLKEKNT